MQEDGRDELIPFRVVVIEIKLVEGKLKNVVEGISQNENRQKDVDTLFGVVLLFRKLEEPFYKSSGAQRINPSWKSRCCLEVLLL